MTAPTAISFAYEGQLFEFKGWTSINSTSTATSKTVAAVGAGQQDVYFFGFQNELNMDIHIKGDDNPTTHANTAIYKAIDFDIAIRISNQVKDANWTVKIYYNDFVETPLPVDVLHNPSTWDCKISSFTWTAKAGEHLNLVSGNITFSLDNKL